MKRFLANEYNVLTARVFLGALFVIASIDKIADPLAFAQSITNYRIIGGASATALATVIPWMELLAGLCMIAGVLLRGSALLAGTLLAVFTGGVISALLRHLDISCGCFTQDPGAATIGWMKVLENAVLVAISAFLYYSNSMRFSIERYVESSVKEQRKGSEIADMRREQE